MTSSTQPIQSDAPLPELLSAARSGSSAALGVLYDRFGIRMHRVALRVTGNVSDAEDVVHDVFVGLPEALRRYEERGSLEAWLVRVTMRTALMRRRSMVRRRETAIDDTQAVSNTVIEQMVEIQSHRRNLADALQRLPEGLRDVVVLRILEDLSHDEIAATLGITAGASRVRLNRAIDALRKLVLRP